MNLKLFIWLLVVIVLIGCGIYFYTGFTKSSSTNFSGSWMSHSTGLDFGLTLRQEGSEIFGKYCSSKHDGTRTDCDPNTETIKGVTNSNSATVNFIDSYGGGKGVATLIFQSDGTLTWSMITKPEGESYLPLSAILQPEGK
jgi:hypothetical protein